MPLGKGAQRFDMLLVLVERMSGRLVCLFLSCGISLFLCASCLRSVVCPPPFNVNIVSQKQHQQS